MERSPASAETRYFAFISYSQDRAAASWLQRALEHFRYPADAIEESLRPDDPRYVREIFLDKTSLSARDDEFRNSLSEALKNSRYLVVICSPRSARRKQPDEEVHWVNWEIETFRKYHGDDADARIIPVVLEGTPDLSETSCLPEPIRMEKFRRRNLPNMDPNYMAGVETEDSGGRLAGRKSKRLAREAAVITLLSYVFKVERNILLDRFALERAKARARIAATGGIALAIATALGVWAWAEEHRAQQANAFRTLVEAQTALDAAGSFGDGEAFNGAPEALRLFSSIKTPLPEACEWLENKLLERSWILPVERHKMGDEEAALFPEVQQDGEDSRPVVSVPNGYPLAFATGDYHRLRARFVGSTNRLWQSKESFPFNGTARIDATGRLLLGFSLAHEPALIALDPLTGRELWRARTDGMLLDWTASDDCRLVALLRMGGDVAILDADNGRRLFETFRAGSDATAIAFSPDGASLLVREGHDDCTVLDCALVRNIADWRICPDAETPGDEDPKAQSSGHAVKHGAFSATIDHRTGGRSVLVETEKGFSGSFAMPEQVQALLFAPKGGKVRLVVAGGSDTVTSDAMEGRAFYAIIDPEERLLLRLRTGLGLNRFDHVEKMDGERILLSGVGAGGSLVVFLPEQDKDRILDFAGAKAVAGVLAGASRDGFPAGTAAELENRLATGGAWRRFIDEARTNPSERHVSYLSPVRNSDAIGPDIPSLFSPTASYSPEQAKLALIVRPDDPEAKFALLLHESREIADYHRQVREMLGDDSESKSLKRHGIQTADRTRFVAKDPIARFYARTLARQIIGRHPKSLAAEEASAFLEELRFAENLSD